MSIDKLSAARQAFHREQDAKRAAEEAERQAVAALEEAKRQRKAAEGNLPKLEREAAAAIAEQETGVHGMLKLAEQHLRDGLEFSKLTGARPPYQARKVARSWLLGSTARDDGTGAIAQLTGLDRSIGSFYEVLRLVDQIGWHTAEQGLGSHLLDRADELSCGAWSALMRRLRWLAGEVEP
jgi:dsDNA-specific endonuclease/ATPase MutS2